MAPRVLCHQVGVKCLQVAVVLITRKRVPGVQVLQGDAYLVIKTTATGYILLAQASPRVRMRV